MKETPSTVKKRFELSSKYADHLSRLAHDYQLSEDQIVESALNILFSLVENLDPLAEQRGWLILPEKLLPRTWQPSDGEEILPSHTMSYDEFLEWADEDTLTEWVDGEVIIADASSDKNQVIREFLHNVLRIFINVNKQGILRGSGFQMKLERSGREPDLVFVATEHLDRLKSSYLDGPADVVVEITSQESIYRDRGEKYLEYEQSGIPEYWLIDPIRQWAEFYVLSTHRRYASVACGTEGVFSSSAIRDFWLRIEWLWHPPPILHALRELEIISGP